MKYFQCYFSFLQSSFNHEPASIEKYYKKEMLEDPWKELMTVKHEAEEVDEESTEPDVAT